MAVRASGELDLYRPCCSSVIPRMLFRRAMSEMGSTEKVWLVGLLLLMYHCSAVIRAIAREGQGAGVYVV